MPCRDYMDDYRSGPDPQVAELKERLDKLSRIACKALTHIEESEDGLEILVLKDSEVQEWWTAHKEADRKAQREKERKEQQRNRLSINPVPPRSFTEQHKEQLRNEKSIKVTCPHCGKEGTMLIMPRWHFNNCKKRP